MASTNYMSADKPTQEQIQQQLKCPRCDSSNTKFCYFNNYSLSQPRHFCKACKRYWTRGGTLRNVPVGGGCRKKRRVKKPAASAAMAAGSSSYNIKTAPSLAPLGTINIPSNPNLFYHGLQHNNTNHNSSELMNLSFEVDHAAGNNSLYEYDQLQPQISFLGFSSFDQSMSTDLLSKSMLSSYQNLPNFGSTLSSSTTISASATMASLLSSNIQQQKKISNGYTRSESSTFIGFPDHQYEDHIQIQGSHDSGVLMSMKELKTVGSLNRLSINKQIEQMVSSSSSDPNSLIWDANGFASWLDPAKSIGYSVQFP